MSTAYRILKILALALVPMSALAQITNPPTWNPPQPPIFIGSPGQVLAVQSSGALAFEADPGGPLPTIATSNVLGNVSGSPAPATAVDALGVTNMMDAMVAVQYSAIANVTSLSGAQTVTIPGNTTTIPQSGTLVLLTAQSSSSANGIWQVNSGAWTRPTIFPSGDVIPSNCNVTVRDNNTGTIFVLGTIGASVTIDTSLQTWTATTAFFAVGNGTNMTVSGSPSATAGVNGGSANALGGVGQSGGAVNITAGASNGVTGVGRGGAVNVTAGNGGGSTNGSGGNVFVTAGTASATSSAGTAGSINLTAGAGGATANGAGGKVTLKPGAPGGTGAAGLVQLEDSSGVIWFEVSTNGGQLPTALTVGTLPSCVAGLTGVLIPVTDANAPTYNGTLTGSSTTYTLALCNGSAWVAH